MTRPASSAPSAGPAYPPTTTSRSPAARAAASAVVGVVARVVRADVQHRPAARRRARREAFVEPGVQRPRGRDVADRVGGRLRAGEDDRGAAEAPAPEQRRHGVAPALPGARADLTVLLDPVRRGLEHPDHEPPGADEGQALGPREQHVDLARCAGEPELLPGERRPPRDPPRPHLGQLLRVARVDDELETPELRERSHGPALHARDALALGCDGGRVDPEPDHGSTERASVRASRPAPRVVRLHAQRREQRAPRLRELARVVEVVAGRQVRAPSTLRSAGQPRLREELVREAHVVASLQQRPAARLRLGMHAVEREPVRDARDGTFAAHCERELEVEEVVAVLVQRTGKLPGTAAKERARLHDVVRASAHHRLDVEGARLEREELRAALVDEERLAVDEQRRRARSSSSSTTRAIAPGSSTSSEASQPSTSPPARAKPLFSACCLAAVRLARPPREPVLVAADHLDGLVAGAAVDDDHLERLVLLLEHGAQRLLEEPPLLVRRNDDANERARQRRAPRRARRSRSTCCCTANSRLGHLAAPVRQPREQLGVAEQRRQSPREIVDVAELRLVARLQMAHDVDHAATVEGDARRAARDALRRGLREHVGERRHREHVGGAVGVARGSPRRARRRGSASRSRATTVPFPATRSSGGSSSRRSACASRWRPFRRSLMFAAAKKMILRSSGKTEPPARLVLVARLEHVDVDARRDVVHGEAVQQRARRDDVRHPARRHDQVEARALVDAILEAVEERRPVVAQARILAEVRAHPAAVAPPLAVERVRDVPCQSPLVVQLPHDWSQA